MPSTISRQGKRDTPSLIHANGLGRPKGFCGKGMDLIKESEMVSVVS